MATDLQVKYFGIMRMIDSTIFASETKDESDHITFRNEFKHLMRKIDDRDIEEGERQTIKSQLGEWFITRDDKRIFYAVLTNEGYPERHAYNLIYEVIQQLKTMSDYYMETESQVQSYVKKFLPQLMEKYCDLKKIDKIYQANEHINDIVLTMSQNIIKTQQNHETLKEVEEKAIDFKEEAKDYHENADNLAKEAAKKKNKTLLILGGVIGGAALIYVIVAFVL